MSSTLTIEEIQNTFKDIQNKICQFLVVETGQAYLQDQWDFQKGTGGGISRVWEGSPSSSVLEKGGNGDISLSLIQLFKFIKLFNKPFVFAYHLRCKLFWNCGK